MQGFEVLTAVVMKSSVFWDIMLCNPLKINLRFGGTYLLRIHARWISQERSQCKNLVTSTSTCFMLVSSLAYSSTLKLQVTCSSETSVDFQRATCRYIQEDIADLCFMFSSIVSRFLTLFTYTNTPGIFVRKENKPVTMIRRSNSVLS
jgi:hypothetical protein